MTFSSSRGSGRRFTGGLVLASLLSLFGLGACAPAVGGGVLVAVVGIGMLTSHCYDYADVTVFDARGRRTCAATVTASNEGDEFELKSCYYAPLTDGHWTIRASLPGFPDTLTKIDVEHSNDCTRHVQSMELTIEPQGSVPVGAPAFPFAPNAAPPAPPAAAESALPPPPPAPPSPASPVSPAPATSSAPPAAPPNSAAPAASTPPASVGVFPDQAPRPSPAK